MFGFFTLRYKPCCKEEMLRNTENYCTDDVLTCLLYVSSWLRAALAFLSSSSRLTVFCMYTVFFSSNSFTCRRKSPRSSSFFLYDSTWLSNLATLSEECLGRQKIEHLYQICTWKTRNQCRKHSQTSREHKNTNILTHY